MNLNRHPVIATASFLMISCAAIGSRLSLPDPLKTREGDRIQTQTEWETIRRPEILELFRSKVYGRASTARPDDLRFDIIEETRSAMSGRATRKLVAIRFTGPAGEGMIPLVIFIPNETRKPVPGFLLICHRSREENIDPTRQNRTPFWPAEEIVLRGYTAAAYHISDLAPDDKFHFRKGVIGLFDDLDEAPLPDAWGAVAAWAWGASRAMDYFESDPEIDESRMAVVGHSRGGKAALWCGAKDERFELVISNNSGCTGAALARRKKGERIKRINRKFPHWFSNNYKQYNGQENKLPIDQHKLIALMAPRLVYVASAEKDKHADPKGEYLACVHADPVYRLYGITGLAEREMPRKKRPLHDGHIGYLSGRDDMT